MLLVTGGEKQIDKRTGTEKTVIEILTFFLKSTTENKYQI